MLTDTVTLQLERVTAGYAKSTPIIHGVSLNARQGEVLLLIGPNGAGKSTILKTTFGQTKLMEGTITGPEGVACGGSNQDTLRAGISFCPQGRCNFPSLTVGQNIRMGGYLLGKSKLQERMDYLRQRFSVVDERWNDRVGNLSGGQQQIVEMSMALIQGPRVLLIDEPSLGLSPAIRASTFETIRGVADDGTTVVMVEQNVREAAEITDRVAVLDQGQVVLSGDHSVVDDPRVRSTYLGAPPSTGDPADEGTEPGRPDEANDAEVMS